MVESLAQQMQCMCDLAFASLADTISIASADKKHKIRDLKFLKAANIEMMRLVGRYRVWLSHLTSYMRLDDSFG